MRTGNRVKLGMRGEVLHYDEGQGFGFITGADGNRYTFTREDMRREAAVGKGTTVEFQVSGGKAKDVFSIRTQLGAAPATAAARTAPHFGRLASHERHASTGLWSYFWRGFTANYANFRDRARRKEYWGFYLFYLVGLAVLVVAGLAADAATGNLDDEGPYVSFTLVGLYMLAMLVPGIAMAVRRQHDIGLSGWFYLLIFVPYIGGMILFVFALIPSQKHENKWGPVPAGITIPPPFTETATGTSR